MNERTNTEELKNLLSNTCFNENKVLLFKTLFIKFLKENHKIDLNRDDLILLDERKNINRDLKRKRITDLIRKCRFKIIKRKVSYLRKRQIKRNYDVYPDYHNYKTFWIIQINQNE